MKGGAIRSSRGISQDPFYVLWRTAMPAVLVECGFMSNPDDRAALVSEKGKEKIASDLYDAFCAYKKEYDGVDSPAPAVSAPKQEQAEPSVKPEATPESEPQTGAYYATQVLVSSKEMKAGDPFFKGNKFSAIRTGRLIKYVIGESEYLAEAKKNYEVLKKSFPDSFLVKVENGETTRIR